MSEGWVVVLALAALTLVAKGAGPLILAHRPLPPRALRLVELVAPVLLASLVAVQAVGGDRELDVDGARLAGLGAALLVLVRGASLVVVMVVAAVVAALIRLAV